MYDLKNLAVFYLIMRNKKYTKIHTFLIKMKSIRINYAKTKFNILCFLNISKICCANIVDSPVFYVFHEITITIIY